MSFNYSKKQTAIFNALAKSNLARQNRGGMWYETGHIAIYPVVAGQQKGTDEEGYRIRSEDPDRVKRDRMTQNLRLIFRGWRFVHVEDGAKPEHIGPRPLHPKGR